MKKYFVEIIIFLAGALTMIFEIVGSRVLGPFFGTSVFVWTSLIGIIMGSLSVGYWAGGKLSEKRSDFIILSWILILAAIFILITAIGNNYILNRIVKYVPDFRFRTILSVLVLFGPASVFFGAVLPFGVKLKITNIKTSGALVGNLYALSTIGSILGTFLAGFVLIPVFGFKNILYAISFIILILSLLICLNERKLIPGFITVLVCSALVIFWIKVYNTNLTYIDVDTQYNRVLIYTTTDESTGRPVKMLNVNNEKSSAMFTDKDDGLVFEVLKYYRLVQHFNPAFKSSLMIGGSGYAFPKDYLNKFPDANIDVVEIDPGLTKLAKKHFGLVDNPRLRIFHEDGRTYLNGCKTKYDAVFVDAYKSMITIPYQLTTVEAVQKIYDVLNKNGAVYANVISSLDENTNYFLRSELATYKSIFPQVYIFAVQYPNPTNVEKSYFQNFIIIGLKSNNKPQFQSEDEELNKYLGNLYKGDLDYENQILTDEYAPVEFFASKALR